MKKYTLLVSLLSVLNLVKGYYVTLHQNGPVVIGATLTLTAELFEDDGSTPTGTYEFIWKDNALKPHTAVFEGKFTRCSWNVTYPPSTFSPGTYEIEVVVRKYEVLYIYVSVASRRIDVNITALLNGEIELIQNGTVHGGSDVAMGDPVEHRVSLAGPDYDFIHSNASSVLTYWFVDCAYQGMSSDLRFMLNYSDTNVASHSIKALVVVSPGKAPTPSPAPPSNTTTPRPEIVSNEVRASSRALPLGVPSPPPPPPCPDASFVPTDPNKTYGYFYRSLTVKRSIYNVTVSGGNWLQHGEMVNITATCYGSPPYSHCVKLMTGEYNVTGKESCTKATETPHCSINVVHYFAKPSQYTILFLIGNSVSKTVTPFGINIYEVQKHAQLSVIVVPISCSVAAVFLIVFGIAYYIQTRSRYMVEVADFDFSQAGGETEVKTLVERLRDAVSGALTRSYAAQDYADDTASQGVVWSPSRKYGSMQ